VNQPTLDTTDGAEPGTDTSGGRWIMALVAPDKKILAGRDLMGNFHCYVDNETLFDNAMTTLMQAQGINIPEMLTTDEQATS
jgi:hypothetical protein